jgi:hypothetical protein
MDVAEIRDSDQEFNFDKIQGRFLEVLQFGKKLGTPI